jgi:hypothetical protein
MSYSAYIATKHTRELKMQVLNNHRFEQISFTDSATGRKAWMHFWHGGADTAVVYAQQPAPVGCDQETFLLSSGSVIEHCRDAAIALAKAFVETGKGSFNAA